jgi:hypothetical protein
MRANRLAWPAFTAVLLMATWASLASRRSPSAAVCAGAGRALVLSQQPPHPPELRHARVVLYGSRVPLVLYSYPVHLDALYPKLEYRSSVAGNQTLETCALLCTRESSCFFYSVNRAQRECYLHSNASEAKLLGMRSGDAFWRGNPAKYAAGTPSRPFILWSSPWISDGRANRTLMVVNHHWRATVDSMTNYMVANMVRLPLDVDVVFVQPYSHGWTLANPWTSHGMLSYLSLWIAHQSLPGYRDYLFTNDDSPILFNNSQKAKHFSSKSWAAQDSHSQWRLFRNDTSATRESWQWFGSGWLALNDAETNAQKSLNRGDRRAEQVLAEMNVSAEVVYYCSTCADAFHVMGGRDILTYVRWAKAFGSWAVFLEIAVPNIFHFGGLHQAQVPYIHAQSDFTQLCPRELYMEGNDYHRHRFTHWVGIHPCKPSQERCQRLLAEFNAVPRGEPWDIGKTCIDMGRLGCIKC